MKLKRIAAMLTAAVMAVSLAACGGNTGTNTESSQNPKENAEAQAVHLNLAESWGFEYFYTILTPEVSSSSYDITYYLTSFYDTLFEYNSEGEVVGVLAEDWSMSEDGKTYTFQIKQGVKFSDGSDLTAEDVAKSILAVPVNLGQYNGSYGRLSTIIEDAVATDEYTVELHLTQPYYNTLRELCLANPFGIVSSEQFNEDLTAKQESFRSATYGTGPYMYAGDNDGQTWNFVRNPNYWGEAPEVDSFSIKYIIKPLGELYMEEVTADDIRLALVPLSKKSEGLYNKVNMLLKCIFYAAERNQILEHNPCAGISGKGGKPTKKKEALTDQQVAVLLDTVKGLPPYLFIMLGLYSGLRREEILALQWDCVFLDEDTPYLSVRRAWRTEHNRPVVSTVLKTPAAKRDIPIPKCLVDCLRETKENSISDYVIADSKGEPLAASQFQRVWQYVVVRSTKPRNYYKYVNGESIKYTVTPMLGMTQKNQPQIKYTLDFGVTPHQLRHTYITNLLYAGVDPKTVQYLAGHENSKTTMDIYAKVKYNKPEELFGVVNGAFHQAIAE